MASVFERKAPGIMRELMADVPTWDEMDAAACVGNAGHESGGLVKLQEIKPTVKGARGGYGWFQWTGPRRRNYEAWCSKQGLNPASDEANYGFLLVELRGDEKAAVAKTHNAVGIEAKTKAFELGFERAGVKHYPSRIDYAKRALAAYRASTKPAPVKTPAPPLQVASPPDKAVMVEGYPEDVVLGAQRTLAAKGYDPGIIDGKYGANTIGAISKAQAENGAPVTGKLDDATLALIAAMPQRPVSDARKAATTDTLREAGSSTVAQADKQSWWGKVLGWLGGGAVTAKAANDSGALDGAQNLIGQGQQVRDVVETGADLWGWVQSIIATMWPIALVGLGVFIWYQARQIKAARVEAVRKGADVAG